MKKINALSLFDGMGCLGIALKDLGVEFNYYTSEIDKHAIAQSKLNFPDSIQLGDVRHIDLESLPKIDIIGGGSPCTDLSFAGKMSGLICNDFDSYMKLREEYLKTRNVDLYYHNGKFQQSILFWEFVRILRYVKEKNPNVIFLLENVKMKKENELVITKYMGVEAIEINAALVSAQSRKRKFWTNIKNRPYGLFGDMMCDIPQPEDRGILLKDILEADVSEKYYLSDKMLNYFSNRAANFNQGKVNIREEEGKASTITASMASCDISDNFIKVDTNLNKANNQDKANCFTAGGNSGGLHSDMTLIVASRGRNPENPKSRKAGLPTEQQLEPRTDGKTNCITSVQKDNLVIQLNPSKESGGKQPYQQNRVYDPNGKNPALCSGQEQWGGNAVLQSDFKIRRLTPTECARLQSIPEWYKWNCSDTQTYRMLGNGFNVEVIKHILKYSNIISTFGA
jgi:DNA (cytosine-5)-methyltransferase 3A